MAYAAGGAGVLLLWAAANNRTVLGTIQDLVQGKKPLPGPGFVASNKIAGSGSPDPGVLGTQNAKIEATNMLARMNWVGQAASFDKLEMGEAGYDPLAENPTTGFFGVAQAGNHGLPGGQSGNRVHRFGLHKGQPINNYGGYGLSTQEAIAANSGDVVMQFKWMGNYIAATYGNPNNAYMKWLSRNPHWY